MLDLDCYVGVCLQEGNCLKVWLLLVVQQI